MKPEAGRQWLFADGERVVTDLPPTTFADGEQRVVVLPSMQGKEINAGNR